MLEIKESMTKSDFDKMVKLEDLEYFTSLQLTNFVKESFDQIVKSEGSKEEMYHELAVEVRSLKPIIVWDDNLEKSIYHVRRRQVEWDKTEGDEISKARGGTYLNTPENQKLGRVGQKYGGNGSKAEDSKGGEKESKGDKGDKKEEKSSDTQTGESKFKSLPMVMEGSHPERQKKENASWVKTAKKGDEFNYNGNLATVTKIWDNGDVNAVWHFWDGDKKILISKDGKITYKGKSHRNLGKFGKYDK